MAQLREEAAARREEDRERRISEARGPQAAPPAEEPRTTEAEQTASEADPEPETDPESMPGSGKKKRMASGSKDKPSHEPNPNGDGIDANLKNFLLSIKTEINQTTNEAINRIDKRIERTEENIVELRARIDDQDRKIETKIVSEVAKLGPLHPPSGGAVAGPAVNSRREKAYFFCRRSLKLWPIEGDDLGDAVRVFLSVRLKMGNERIRAIGDIEVSLTPGKAPRERKEVLATFETVEDRDTVKASGSNLAGQREAGMAVHVPGHLLDNFYALNGVGYSIKANNVGVRRAIKFDDTLQDIYLDIFVGGQWKKITPGEAKNAMKKIPASSAYQLTNSLSGDDISSLIQGVPVPGITAVVLPEDDPDS